MVGRTYKTNPIKGASGRKVTVFGAGAKTKKLKLATALAGQTWLSKTKNHEHVVTTDAVTPKLRGKRGLLILTGPDQVRGPTTVHVKKGRPASILSRFMDARRPVGDRLRIVGAEPGAVLDDKQVQHVMAAFRGGAEEATGSANVARDLLKAPNFDGTGLTAEQLVRVGRSGRVLARIDDLRFGTRG